MKKKLYAILLIILFQAFIPITCFASTISLNVNHIPYTPKYAAKFIKDTLYISAEDLAHMTYGTYQKQATNTLLTIQFKNILIDEKPSSYIKVSNEIVILPKKTIVEGDVLYLPTCILDTIEYPYTLENNTFNLTTLRPYSMATDTYDLHTLLQTPHCSLVEALAPLLDSTASNELIKSCYLNNQYISFISTYNKKENLSALRELALNQSKKYTVSFRKIFPTKTSFTIGHLTKHPLTYEVRTNDLLLTVDKEAFSNTCFWSTYNPLIKSTQLDLNKSLDVMIMRSLYEYYRDLYHFKDDLNTLPLVKVQMGRSDSMSYKVYLEHGTVKDYYTITVYKQNSSKNVHYYVDIALFS